MRKTADLGRENRVHGLWWLPALCLPIVACGDGSEEPPSGGPQCEAPVTWSTAWESFLIESPGSLVTTLEAGPGGSLWVGGATPGDPFDTCEPRAFLRRYAPDGTVVVDDRTTLRAFSPDLLLEPQFFAVTDQGDVLGIAAPFGHVNWNGKVLFRMGPDGEVKLAVRQDEVRAGFPELSEFYFNAVTPLPDGGTMVACHAARFANGSPEVLLSMVELDPSGQVRDVWYPRRKGVLSGEEPADIGYPLMATRTEENWFFVVGDGAGSSTTAAMVQKGTLAKAIPIALTRDGNPIEHTEAVLAAHVRSGTDAIISFRNVPGSNDPVASKVRVGLEHAKPVWSLYHDQLPAPMTDMELLEFAPLGSGYAGVGIRDDPAAPRWGVVVVDEDGVVLFHQVMPISPGVKMLPRAFHIVGLPETRLAASAVDLSPEDVGCGVVGGTHPGPRAPFLRVFEPACEDH